MSLENIDKRMVALLDPGSLAAEQFRILRTRILMAGNTQRVFLISSAVGGEGKTLTTVNLAISIAKGLHENVLMIDADLRKPSLANLLDIPFETKGLAEYLSYGGDLAAFITKTPIQKVSLITSGLPPENPSELIGSNRMIDLIKEVKARYDDRYIIIDSPPLIPVTDSTILASLVDGVILVLKAFSTPRDMVDKGIRKIENRENIIGLVINGCKGIEYKYGEKYDYAYSRNYVNK